MGHCVFSRAYREAHDLQKDLMCLLRMYDGGRQAISPEEGLASPFTRLRLLAYRQDGRTRRYRLLSPDFEHLHPLILLYVLTSQQVQARGMSSLVSLTDVLYEAGNAGRIFPLLTRNVLLDVFVRLREVARAWNVALIRQAGQEHLSLPTCTPEEILYCYYQTKR